MNILLNSLHDCTHYVKSQLTGARAKLIVDADQDLHVINQTARTIASAPDSQAYILHPGATNADILRALVSLLGRAVAKVELAKVAA